MSNSKDNKKKKKVGIIAGSIVAAGIVAGGVVGGVLASNAKVSISFNADNGLEYKTTKIKKGSTTALPVPFRAGYKFQGWYLDPALSTAATESTKFNKDTVLYAKWKENVYTINYVDEKNISNIQSDTYQIGHNFYINDPVDPMNNYKFVGWSETREKDNLVGIKLSDRTSYTVPLYGTTLYAIWEGKEVNVEVEGINEQLSNVKIGESFTLPVPDLSNFNGNFLGYYAGVKGSSYYKEFLPGQTIEIEPEGIVDGVFKLSYLNSMYNADNKVIYIDYDGNLASVENFNEPSLVEGYEFDGWYRKQDLTGEEVKSLSEVENELKKGVVVLYAKRNPLTITFNLAYGDAELIAGEQEKLTFTAKVGETIVLPHVRSYAKKNVDLIAWNEEGNKLGNCGDIYTVKYNGKTSVDLQAVWGSAFNLLHFNLNGGNGDISIDCRETGFVTLPDAKNNPSKLGYNFLYWSVKKVVDSDFDIFYPGDRIDIQEPTILYAIYEAKEYRIKYDLGFKASALFDNASFGGDISTVSVSEADTMPGYKLAGWNVVYSDNSTRPVNVGAN